MIDNDAKIFGFSVKELSALLKEVRQHNLIIQELIISHHVGEIHECVIITFGDYEEVTGVDYGELR